MRPRVLIVHDAQAARAILSHHVQSAGGTAISVEDHASALGLLRGEPPDVVITDERATASHPEAVAALRDAFPGAVVIVLAAPQQARASAVYPLGASPTDDQVEGAIEWALHLADQGPL